jgi:hypothetical protein
MTDKIVMLLSMSAGLDAMTVGLDPDRVEWSRNKVRPMGSDA